MNNELGEWIRMVPEKKEWNWIHEMNEDWMEPGKANEWPARKLSKHKWIPV